MEVFASFIVPTLNEEKYIGRCLKAIREQKTKISYEIIVSDGGSSDKTIEIAKKYADMVLVAPKRGIAFGRNYGAKFAKGKLLIFIDADTIVERDFLDKVSKSMENHPAGMPKLILISEEKKMEKRLKILTELYHSLNKALSKINKMCLIGAATIVWKDVFERVGGFPEVPSEDVAFSKKIRKIGKLKYIEEAKVYFSLRRFEKGGWLNTIFYYATRDLVTYIKSSKKAKWISKRIEPLASYKLFR